MKKTVGGFYEDQIVECDGQYEKCHFYNCRIIVKDGVCLFEDCTLHNVNVQCEDHLTADFRGCLFSLDLTSRPPVFSVTTVSVDALPETRPQWEIPGATSIGGAA